MSELDVALLLFSIGLEFSLSRLRQIGRVAIFGGLVHMSVTLPAGDSWNSGGNRSRAQ